MECLWAVDEIQCCAYCFWFMFHILCISIFHCCMIQCLSQPCEYFTLLFTNCTTKTLKILFYLILFYEIVLACSLVVREQFLALTIGMHNHHRYASSSSNMHHHNLNVHCLYIIIIKYSSQCIRQHHHTMVCMYIILYRSASTSQSVHHYHVHYHHKVYHIIA